MVPTAGVVKKPAPTLGSRPIVRQAQGGGASSSGDQKYRSTGLSETVGDAAKTKRNINTVGTDTVVLPPAKRHKSSDVKSRYPVKRTLGARPIVRKPIAVGAAISSDDKHRTTGLSETVGDAAKTKRNINTVGTDTVVLPPAKRHKSSDVKSRYPVKRTLGARPIVRKPIAVGAAISSDDKHRTKVPDLGEPSKIERQKPNSSSSSADPRAEVTGTPEKVKVFVESDRKKGPFKAKDGEVLPTAERQKTSAFIKSHPFEPDLGEPSKIERQKPNSSSSSADPRAEVTGTPKKVKVFVESDRKKGPFKAKHGEVLPTAERQKTSAFIKSHPFEPDLGEPSKIERQKPASSSSSADPRAEVTVDTGSVTVNNAKTSTPDHAALSQEKFAVLRGNCSQDSNWLIVTGVQCTAIAGYVLAKNFVKNFNLWTPADLDDCIFSGTSFYVKNKDVRDRREYSLSSVDFLEAFELTESIVIDDKTLVLSFQPPDEIFNGSVLEGKGNFEKLKNTLELIKQTGMNGILTLNERSFAIFGSERSITLIDSHPVDENGICSADGVAAIMIFESVNKMLSVLPTNVKAEHYQKLRCEFMKSDIQALKDQAHQLNHYSFFSCSVEVKNYSKLPETTGKIDGEQLLSKKNHDVPLNCSATINAAEKINKTKPSGRRTNKFAYSNYFFEGNWLKFLDQNFPESLLENRYDKNAVIRIDNFNGILSPLPKKFTLKCSLCPYEVSCCSVEDIIDVLDEFKNHSESVHTVPSTFICIFCGFYHYPDSSTSIDFDLSMNMRHCLQRHLTENESLVNVKTWSTADKKNIPERDAKFDDLQQITVHLHNTCGMGYPKIYQFEENLSYESNRYGAFLIPEIHYVDDRFELVCRQHGYTLIYDVRENDSRGAAMAIKNVFQPRQIFPNQDSSHEHAFANLTGKDNVQIILGCNYIAGRPRHATRYSELLYTLLDIKLQYPEIPIFYGQDNNLPSVFWRYNSLEYKFIENKSLQYRVIAETTALVNKELGNVQFAPAHSESGIQLENFFGKPGLVKNIESTAALVDTGGDRKYHEPFGFVIGFPPIKNQQLNETVIKESISCATEKIRAKVEDAAESIRKTKESRAKNPVFAKRAEFYDCKFTKQKYGVRCNECHLLYGDRSLFILHYRKIHEIHDTESVNKRYIKVEKGQRDVHCKKLKEDMFECTLCKSVFSNKRYYDNHFSLYHSKERMPLKCPMCTHTFTVKGDLLSHFGKIHVARIDINISMIDIKNGDLSVNEIENIMQGCKKEELVKVDPSERELHYLTTKDKPMCGLCEKVFDNKNKFNRHFDECHSNDHQKIPCDLCDESFSRSEKHIRHLRETHRLSIKVASRVNQTYLQRIYNKKQYILVDTIEKDDHCFIDEDEKYVCDLCGQKYKTVYKYNDHFFAKHDRRQEKFLCEHCSKSFDYKYNLTAHLKQFHPKTFRKIDIPAVANSGKQETSDIKKVKYILVDGNKINDHVVYIKGRYKCKLCEKTFVDKQGYRLHFTTSHDKDYERLQCDHCHVSCTTKPHLRGHLRVQHRELYEPINFKTKKNISQDTNSGSVSCANETSNYFECGQCQKTFEDLYQLIGHLEMVHKIIFKKKNDSKENAGSDSKLPGISNIIIGTKKSIIVDLNKKDEWYRIVSGRHTCGLCGLNYSTRQSFNVHFKNKHQKDLI